MLDKGLELRFRLASTSAAPGVFRCEVQDVDASGCRVVFTKASPPLLEGVEALIFFELGSRSLQQLVRIRGVVEVTPSVVLSLELRSAPLPLPVPRETSSDPDAGQG